MTAYMGTTVRGYIQVQQGLSYIENQSIAFLGIDNLVSYMQLQGFGDSASSTCYKNMVL